MRRRAFLATLLATGATGKLFAQKPPLVALLTTATIQAGRTSEEHFLAGMRELGHAENTTFRLERRHWSGDDPGAVAALIAELLAHRPDVLVVNGTTVVQAAKKASATVPIVAASSSDLVTSGLVKSYARPGGNVTGVTSLIDVVTAKRVEILVEALPAARKVMLLQNPHWPIAKKVEGEANKVAARLRVDLVHARAGDAKELDDWLDRLPQQRPDAIVIGPHTLFSTHAGRIIDRSARIGVPVVHYRPDAALRGALLVLGVDIPAQYRRAASFVDRILKGAQPGDLPIEQVTKYDVIVNLKAAKALGLSVSPTVLVRADRVIE